MREESTDLERSRRMEIEAKFLIGGREDFLKALRVLEEHGYRPLPYGKVRYSDTYYDPGDGGALRFREYEDGRVVRTYKRDRKTEEGVIYREESEREVSREEMRGEVEGTKPILQTLTVRERYVSGEVQITYDVVWYDDATQMAFLEVEGPEEDVKRVARILKDAGFKPESKSKLAIGLSLKGRGA